MSQTKTAEQYSRERAARLLQSASSGLHELAQQIERLGNWVERGEGPSAAYVTSQALHLHAVWLMSAKFDAAIGAAAEADVFAAEAAAARSVTR
jgi:hypothetical protein